VVGVEPHVGPRIRMLALHDGAFFRGAEGSAAACGARDRHARRAAPVGGSAGVGGADALAPVGAGPTVAVARRTVHLARRALPMAPPVAAGAGAGARAAAHDESEGDSNCEPEE
jgi:hypothetical protein